jgi:hypothetical protein
MGSDALRRRAIAAALLAAGALFSPIALPALSVSGWTRQYGSTWTDNARGVAATSEGVYLAGYSVVGEGLVATLLKVDLDGHHVWTRQLGKAAYNAVKATADAVYVAGRVEGTTGEYGDYDVVVLKYDLAGNLVWARRFGTPEPDSAEGISATGEAVYVAGATQGVLPGQTTAGSSDAFVRKYDHNGNEVWTRQFGNWSGTQATGVSATDNRVYVGGNVHGDFGLAIGQPPPGYDHNGFVRAYDVAGNELWSRVFGRTLPPAAGETRVWSVSGTDQLVVVAGSSRGATLLDGYDWNGNQLFASGFDLDERNVIYGVSVTTAAIYVVGTFEDYDDNLGYTMDAFIRKHDLSGNHLWTRTFGQPHPAKEHATAVMAFPGGVAAAGYTDGSLAAPNAGSYDMFVMRYTFQP